MALKLILVPLGALESFKDAANADFDRSLRALLHEAPAFSVGQPLDDKTLDTPVGQILIRYAKPADYDNAALYAPPGLLPRLQQSPDAPAEVPPGAAATAATAPPDTADAGHVAHAPSPSAAEPAAGYPATLSEAQAVAIAYQNDIRKLATFLRARLSLLVSCEKLVVPYLWKQIIEHTWLAAQDGSAREIKPEPVLLHMPAEGEERQGGNRLEALRKIIHELKPDQVLVIPNLDLLSGGDKGLSKESRELTELIYAAQDRLVLAFIDPSLALPEVIHARFPVRVSVAGLPRAVTAADGRPVLIGNALVTQAQAAMFSEFDPQELYKNIAGLNPLRLREGLAYAVQLMRDRGHGPDHPAPVKELHQALRAFKAQSAEQFIVPNVKFDDIGGYADVKRTLLEAIALIAGAGSLPDESLRAELVPRGFLFYGPPGTGKTLFAKAIANQLNASVRIVSGPEVTDMYVGESERKVRAIFAEARRNAPAVIVFDEFDSIAARRTGRDDGGSRAGNALVAQILTEMDGFRPDVPMLVIGTTNRLGLIDEALLRPSRFQPIAIDLPDTAARREIAKHFAAHFRISVNPDLLDIIAQATQGLNGDEIRALFRDACVGHYYQQPPDPADARKLGYLLGRIRTRLDSQQVQEKKVHTPGVRHRPGAGHVRLT